MSASSFLSSLMLCVTLSQLCTLECRARLWLLIYCSGATLHPTRGKRDATENVDSYEEFLRTPNGQANIPTFAEELERAQQYHNQDAPSDGEDEEDAHHEEQEDWMVLCQLHCDLSTVSNQPDDVDWADYCRTLPPATIIEAAKWIQTTKVNTSHQDHCRHSNSQH